MHRLTAFVLALGMCGYFGSPAAAEEKTLLVFAAASMKNALDDIDAAFTAKTGVKLSVSYAASSTLAKQIEQGAPADIFISADTDWMDYAVGRKTINETTRINLLGNSIVLIAPKDSRFDNVAIGPGFDLAKLAGDGRIAWRREGGPGRQVCESRASKTWCLAGCRGQIRNGRERAVGLDFGSAGRSCARHCLFD